MEGFGRCQSTCPFGCFWVDQKLLGWPSLQPYVHETHSAWVQRASAVFQSASPDFSPRNIGLLFLNTLFTSFFAR